jgi:hypothetical protein
MKKKLFLTFIFLVIISTVKSQVIRKRYFRDSKVFIELPTTFMLGSTPNLNDFTQDQPNISITLTVKIGSYSEQIDKVLKMLSYTGGTKDKLINDITHRGQPAKYITFDQMIAEGLPWYHHQHLIFGNTKITCEIMAVYEKDVQLEKTVESYLLSAGIDE